MIAVFIIVGLAVLISLCYSFALILEGDGDYAMKVVAVTFTVIFVVTALTVIFSY